MKFFLIKYGIPSNSSAIVFYSDYHSYSKKNKYLKI